jgi:lysophospholipase L1-like esterase
MLKSFSLLLLLSCFVLTSMLPSKNIHVIFLGDSISQMGVEEGGFIKLLDPLLKQKDKSNDYKLTGAGISGDKVYDLYLRLQKDVLDQRPDIVMIWIGVNDVWHKQTFGTGTDADKFENFYTAIIKKLQSQNIKIILATPAVIGEKKDFVNQQDGDLNLYSEIIRKLAVTYQCGLADMRKEFLDYNQKYNSSNKTSGILTYDGVHLNKTGNEVVAGIVSEVLIKKFN